MINQWEEFPIGPSDVAHTLHVTLDKKGEILIGATAFERFGKPDFAVLLFDKVSGMIGVLPSNKHAANAYPLKVKGNNRHRIIQASKFCTHYGIKVDRRVAFTEPKIDPEGVLILNLKQTRNVGKPPNKISNS